MRAPPDLHEIAQSLLDVVIETFRDRDRRVPERRYVADGPDSAVAIDCEQLVVAIGPIVPGPVGSPPPDGQLDDRLVWSTTLVVDSARPAPVIDQLGTAPTNDAIGKSAKAIFGDAMALLIAARAYSTRCRPLFEPTVTFLGPEGGFVRAVLLARVNIL